MIFGCRDVPWNASTKVLDLCKIIFIFKISNAESLPPATQEQSEINPNTYYPIWSPDDCYEAAHKLEQMLEEHYKK